jgi:hypothetical protein
MLTVEEKQSIMKTVTIPSGVGYNEEYNGNITGSFHRAGESITATFERDHGQQVIFKLPNGKRGMTRKDLVTIA